MSAAGPQQDVAGRIRALRQECQHLSQKLAELEQDIHEHECVAALPRCARTQRPLAAPLTRAVRRRLVHDTLGSVDSERKCFRLVGGVLVERTVQEVLPAVEQHKAGVRRRAGACSRPRAVADPIAQIKQLIDTLSSQLKKKEEELNKLQVRPAAPPPPRPLTALGTGVQSKHMIKPARSGEVQAQSDSSGAAGVLV